MLSKMRFFSRESRRAFSRAASESAIRARLSARAFSRASRESWMCLRLSRTWRRLSQLVFPLSAARESAMRILSAIRAASAWAMLSAMRLALSTLSLYISRARRLSKMNFWRASSSVSCCLRSASCFIFSRWHCTIKRQSNKRNINARMTRFFFLRLFFCCSLMSECSSFFTIRVPC